VARIGILGGTFNPPHIGHLVCAQEAHAQLGLDVVVLMPVHAPPHKPAREDPGPEHRVELCRLATATDERLSVSRLEVDRPGPSFTVDTLRALHDTAPGDELVLIVGGDMAASLPTWREPEEVLARASVAATAREGLEREQIVAALAGLEGGDRLTFFDMPRIDVSSTMIRARVASGKPVRYLVPDAVAQYVERHGLYRVAVTAG